MNLPVNTILFRDMTEEEITEALEYLRATPHKYRRNQYVLRAGRTTDNIGLVTSGSVTIESNDMWGNRTVLSKIGPGDIFAETYALVRTEPLLVDVRADEQTEILWFNVTPLTSEIQSDNSLGSRSGSPVKAKLIRNLLLISSRKNLLLSRRSFHTSPKKVRARIQAYLNSVSLQQGSKDFDIPFDRQQMADYLNLDRTALSKELGRMKREGIIDFWKNHFRIIG